MWLKIGEGRDLVGMADSQGGELFVDVSKIILHNAITIQVCVLRAKGSSFLDNKPESF